MPDMQYPSLIALSFGLAILVGACFVYFSRTLSQHGTGHRWGLLLIDACVVAMGGAGTVLVAGLAFSTPAMAAAGLDWLPFLIVPALGCAMLALRLSASPTTGRRLVGAAGVVAASTLLAPLAGALTSDAGRAWIGAPGGMAIAALLAFAIALPGLALLARRPPAFWHSAAATLLLAVGWLLPQFLHLTYWPAGASGATAFSPGAWALFIAFDTLAVGGLLLLSRHLIGRATSTQFAELTEARTANDELVSHQQNLENEKQLIAGNEARRCEQWLLNANIGTIDWDLPAAKVSYGGAWVSMLGYDQAHSERLRLASDPLLPLCHPGELHQAQRLLREIASGERKRMHCDLRLRSAQNAWHWVHVYAQAVEWHTDGSPRRVLGTLLDIDRIKHVEHLLLAERRLFASGPVIILTFDAEAPHLLRQASSNLQEAYGHPEQRLLAGQPLDALLHPDDAARLAESVARAVAQPGIQAHCEVRLAKTDGSWPWYLLHVIADRPTVGKQLRAYLVDINRLKEAESHAADHNTALQEMVHKMGEAQHFMETLQQVTELLQLCECEDESEQIIIQGGPQLFPRWSGALTFAGEDGLMTAAASWGQPCLAEHADEADCWAVRRGRLHQSSADPATHVLSPVCSHFGGDGALPPGVKHTICAPLLKSFDRPGVLHLIAFESMSDEELQSAAWGAETFADALKLSLGNLRLRTSLRDQAVHDEMTDLYNRRYFDEALNRELSRSQRTGEGLILAILDIDHFKNFNDTCGHEAGDEVLKKVAEQLRSFVRSYDIACRVGGEELAIIMPRVQIDEACVRLDQLREEIAASALMFEGKQLPAITVSIGVADLDAGAPDDLLRRADSALYSAKNGGRNQVKRWIAGLEEESRSGAVAAAGRARAGPDRPPKAPARPEGRGPTADREASRDASGTPPGASAGKGDQDRDQDGGDHENGDR